MAMELPCPCISMQVRFCTCHAHEFGIRGALEYVGPSGTARVCANAHSPNAALDTAIE